MISLDNIKKFQWKIILIIVLAILCFISMRQCSENKSESLATKDKITLYEAQAKIYRDSVNKYGEMMSTQKAMISDRDSKLEKVLLEHSNLKSLNEQIQIQSEIKIKGIIAKYSVNVVHTDTIRYTDSSGIKHVVECDTACTPYGTKFNKFDKWFLLTGSVQKDGIHIDSLSAKDSLTINVGYKKNSGLFGFLKEKQLQIEAVHGSPYNHTTGMENIIFNDKARWFEKKPVIFGFGLSLGFVLALEGVHLLSK